MGLPTREELNTGKKEFCQKECIKDALTHLNDADLVFVGDCDEVWGSEILSTNIPTDEVLKLLLFVYSYYLNNRSSEVFWGTIVSIYKNIRISCLNHLRSDEHYKMKVRGGWHFTSMGGYEEVKRKLSDSYTRESYWTEQVENNLKDNIENSKDFLGRGFYYKIDESNLPQYLKDNKDKYKHLWKQ